MKKSVVKKNNNVPIKELAPIAKSFKTFFIVASFILVLITTSIYYKSLSNDFVRWDDPEYVTRNPDIRTFHGDSLNITFKNTFTSYVRGNYHPLTMLSYCVDYNMYKLNPKPYHRNNLILHILNTLLVFCFIWLLTQKKWVAVITALLFSVHPMHVESVAWISERKDVLYSFFYLAALCTYVLYLKKEKWKWLFYSMAFLLFFLGVISKAMAVSLPIVFIAIDYFSDRKINLKTILEKVPFIILAFIFGYIAIKAQESINAISTTTDYGLFDRILFTCYALVMYIWKFFAPFNLSCYYDYPVKQEGVYPAIVYIAPLIILTFAFLIFRSIKFGKYVLFGIAFFLITIALVLQVLPVGGAIIADRYTYLPYIGLFFILAQWINNLLENRHEKLKDFKNISIVILTLVVVVFSYLTIQRCKVWKDTITLFTDAIEKFDESPQSFQARGDAYSIKKQYDKALVDFNRAIQLKHDYSDAYYNRGLVYYYLGQYEKAIDDCTSAIQYNPTLAIAYYNRAGYYFTLQKYQLALDDALKAKQIGGIYVDPLFIEALQTSIKNSSIQSRRIESK